MVKEKSIQSRNIQSPLLFDVGRIIMGPLMYWDVSVKEVGQDRGVLDRVRVFLEAKGIKKVNMSL